MRKIKERDKCKFHEIVYEFHQMGLSYTESVCKVMELLELKNNEVVKLIDDNLKEKIKQEGVELHLLVKKEGA